jgi:hypothetical protein
LQIAEARGDAANPAQLVDQIMPQLARTFGEAETPAPRDLIGEAKIHAQEADWAVACQMPVTAMRAADTAWALGLRTPELARLRTTIAPQAITNEAARIGVIVRNLDESEIVPKFVPDLLRHKNRPADAMTPSEFLELASRAFDAWQEAATPDPAWINGGARVLQAAKVVFLLFDTAEMLDHYEPALNELAERLRHALELAIAKSSQTPETATTHAWLCEFAARTLPLWTANPNDALKFARRLLAENFVHENLATRVRVRLALLETDRGLIETDVNWRDAIGGRVSGSSTFLARPGRLPRTIFAALGREFANANNLEDRAFAQCAAFRAAAFGFRNPDLTAAAGQTVEALSKMFPQDPKTARAALAMHSEQLAKKLDKQNFAGQVPKAAERAPASASSEQAGDVPFARLRWRARDVIRESDDEANLATESLVWAEESIWGYVQRRKGNAESGSIVRISVPELRTLESIDLPALPPAQSAHSAFRLAITPKHVIVFALGRALVVAERVNHKWRVEPGIVPMDAMAISPDAGLLFVATDDRHGQGVARYDLARGISDLLVSTRRAPPESPLDNSALRLARVYLSPQGELIVSAVDAKGKKVTGAWLPTRQPTWRAVDRTVEEPGKAATLFANGGWIAFGTVDRGAAADEHTGILRLRRAAGTPARDLTVRAEALPAADFGEGFVAKNPGINLPSMWHQSAAGYILTNANLGGAIWFLPATAAKQNSAVIQ